MLEVATGKSIELVQAISPAISTTTWWTVEPQI